MSNKKYINITIDGDKVDLPDELPNIELSFKISEDDIGTTSGSSSERSLALPASKQNDVIFGRWWNIGEQNLSAAEFKQASIEVNGLPILNGRAQLKEATTRGARYKREGDGYKVAFYGSNADWFLRLKDKELGRDLDWSSDLHQLGTLLISTLYNADPLTSNYCYTIVKWRDWTGTSGNRVDVLQSTPGIFIRAILDKIFNSIGYTLNSTFLSSAVFRRYILLAPLVDKYPQEYSEDYLNITAEKTTTDTLPGGLVNIVGIAFDNQLTAPNIGPNPYIASVATSIVGGAGTTSRYTAPEYGFYQFKMSVIIDNVTTGGGFGFNPISLAPTFPNSTTDNVYTVSAADNGTRFTYSIVGELNAGDVVEFYAGGAGAVGGGTVLDIVGGTLEVIGESVIREGSNIDFKYLLRDWKITDFLRGLTEAFNLLWETNTGTGQITVEPKDPYLYTDRGTSTSTFLDGFLQNTTTDTTPKLDFEKKGKVTALNNTSEVQRFKWREDNQDPTQEFLNQGEDIEVFGAGYNLPLNRFKPDTKERENSFFAATLCLFDREVTADTSRLVVQVPLIWSKNYLEDNTSDEPNYNVEPRLLWFGGQRNAGDTDGIIKVTAGGVDSEVIMPATFFVNYNDDTALDPSLSFSNETVLNNAIAIGHLQRFYLRDMARLRAGKRRESWLYLRSTDILNLSFRPKLLINGNLHVLQEVKQFSPLIDRSTKVILIYDQRDEQEDLNRIEPSVQNGFISDFEYSEK